MLDEVEAQRIRRRMGIVFFPPFGLRVSFSCLCLGCMSGT